MNRIPLSEHIAMETEGELTPAQADPISHAEHLLEEARFKRVMRMTAIGFGRLSDVEKRNYTRWAKHFAGVFAEQAARFERNAPGDIEVPAYLQARG